MAQSIRQQLNSGKVEVQHKGQHATFDLPDWMHMSDSTLDNEPELLEHLRAHNIDLVALIHAGLDSNVIKVRAKARPSEDDATLDTATNRAKAREHMPSRLTKPGQTTEKKAAGAIQALLDQGWSMEQIMQLANK